jgi:hypothetical protein
MKARIVLQVAVVAMLVVGLGRADAQTLDEGAIAGALQAGAAKKPWSLMSTCIATTGFGETMLSGSGVQPTGSFDVRTSRAAGRIASIAYDAKRLYKPFGLADVTPELRDDSIVYVSVAPLDPARTGNTYNVPSPIERIVLKSKSNPNMVAQPSDIAFEAREWSNLVGGKVQGNAAVAKFNLADVRELPPGDVDVVVITQAGERRCKIGGKDRSRIIESASSTSQQR